MASFQSFLHVGGQVYEILYYDLELGQAVDSLGRPASPVYGGILTIGMHTPANDTTLYEWMVNPAKRMDGQVILRRLDSRATLKSIKFYNAFCVDMVLRFDGTANASSFKLTIRISPEQVEIGGLMHDNLWPDESPIGYVPDETAPKEDQPSILSRLPTSLPQLPDTKMGLVGNPFPTLAPSIVPPITPPITLPPGSIVVPVPPPNLPGNTSPLMRQVLAWMQGKTGKAVLIGASVLLVAYLIYKLNEDPKGNAGPTASDDDAAGPPLTKEEEERLEELEEIQRKKKREKNEKMTLAEYEEMRSLQKRKEPKPKGTAKEIAYKEAQGYIDNVSKGQLPYTLTVIVDEETGEVYVGRNGGVKSKEELEEDTRKRLPEPSRQRYPSHQCAEVDALDQALEDGADPENLEQHTVELEKQKDGGGVVVVDRHRCNNCVITSHDIRTTSDHPDAKGYPRPQHNDYPDQTPDQKQPPPLSDGPTTKSDKKQDSPFNDSPDTTPRQK